MVNRLKETKAGFTLVELIVVIAILGILAGISVPVYSGYIEKARKASDLQLLGAINTAFSAACAEMRVPDPQQVNATASLDGARKLSTVSVSGYPGFNDAFMKYYAGNEDKAFRTFDYIGYDRTEGIFKGYAAGETVSIPYTYTVGGVEKTGTLNVDAAKLAAYMGSTYDDLGSAVMTNEIDRLVGTAIDAIAKENAGTGLGHSEAFQSFLDTLAWEDEEGVVHTYSWDTMTDAQKANSLVLYTASLADKINVDGSIASLLEGGSLAIDDLRPGTKQELLTTTAAEYALMMAYCSGEDAKLTTTTEDREVKLVKNQLGNEVYAKEFITSVQDAADDAAREQLFREYYAANDYPEGTTSQIKWNANGTINNITLNVPGTRTEVDAGTWFDNYEITSAGSIIGAHVGSPYDYDGMWDTFSQSQEFQNYIETQGASNLSAYVSALQMVNDNTSNVDIDSVLTNGWKNGGIAELISQITGN